MRKNEDRILTMNFEAVLKFLTDGIFECYKVSPNGASDGIADGSSDEKEATKKDSPLSDSAEDSLWMTNQFVCDAYAVQMWVYRLHVAIQHTDSDANQHSFHAGFFRGGMGGTAASAKCACVGAGKPAQRKPSSQQPSVSASQVR